MNISSALATASAKSMKQKRTRQQLKASCQQVLNPQTICFVYPNGEVIIASIQ